MCSRPLLGLSVISLLRSDSVPFGCEADMRTVDRSNQSAVNDPEPSLTVRRGIKRGIVSVLLGHDPHGRVTWQSASDDGNSLSRLAARQRHGRSSPTHSSRRCRRLVRWLLAMPIQKSFGECFGKGCESWGTSKGKTFDLSFDQRKDRSLGFPNWPPSWSVSKSI